MIATPYAATRVTLPAETAIAAALAKQAAAVDAVGPGRWAFTLSNGSPLAARARVDDGWLLIDAALGAGAPPAAPASRVWEMLQWNATLAGGIRFVLGPQRFGARGARVCAELPLDDEVDLGRRIGEACAGLKAAKRRMTGGASAGGTCGDAAGEDLSALCRQTGWAFLAREGRLAVDLEVPGAFQQAVVETREDQHVAVSVPVLDAAVAGAAPPATVCRQALGLLLVRVGGIVRMARAAAEPREGAPRARFEVVFGTRPCAAELQHAFAALSIACRVAGREAAVLWGDADVARTYVTHWDAHWDQIQKKEDHSWDRQRDRQQQ